MNIILRIIRCLLGVASPSRVAIRDHLPPPRTWLDRWERRIDARIEWPPKIVMREEVQVIATSREVLKRIDVTDRSERAARRVLNRERRRAAGVGREARITWAVEEVARKGAGR